MIRTGPSGWSPATSTHRSSAARASRTSSYGPRTMTVAARHAARRLKSDVARWGDCSGHGHEDLDPAVGRHDRTRRPVRAPAEVPDRQFQVIERRPDIAVGAVGHRECRDGDGGHRSDDDVRPLGAGRAHLDLDVDRGETAIDLTPFALEFASPSVEGLPEICTPRDEAADLGQTDAHVPERDDPSKLWQLRGRVVAVVGRWVDPDRPEQGQRVIRPKHLGRDAGEAGEGADREHVPSIPLDLPPWSRFTLVLHAPGEIDAPHPNCRPAPSAAW